MAGNARAESILAGQSAACIVSPVRNRSGPRNADCAHGSRNIQPGRLRQFLQERIEHARWKSVPQIRLQ
jgi:hypothetical protein